MESDQSVNNPPTPESFKDIPLSDNSLPKDDLGHEGVEIDSDQDTLVSDSEDKEIANEYFNKSQRERPSFTIGGSDSDSTSTSTTTDVEYWKHVSAGHQSSDLTPIPSGSENLSLSNKGVDGISDCLPQGRIGYMGGSSGSRSQLNRSPSIRTAISGNKTPENLEASYKEIRLFSTDEASAKFTTRQWLTFAVFGFVELFSAMVISLQAPFYPFEAEKKGASATEYGLVFGIFELTVFVISPIYGSKINKIGPKLVFNLGIFVTSISAITFGFLDKVDNRTLFVGLSIFTRIAEALGEAAFITASFVIIAAEFPHSVATTFATMETFYGVGLIIGPLAGGLLYQIGGYTLPFLTVGGLLLIAALFTTFALPSTMRNDSSSLSPVSANHSGTEGFGFKMFSLLTVPTISLAAFSIFSASASISYLSPTLEPFIRSNNLSSSPVETGAIFIVNGGVYAITSPIWGWICDRVENHLKIVSIVGCVLIFVGFGLIGPIPYVALEPSLWGVLVGQAIQGVGLGAVLVSAFIQSLREAIKTGLPDNVQTYSLVSGVWTSMFALGAFAGPTVAGVLYDIIGFRKGTLSILGLQLLVAVLVLCSICCSCCSKTDGSDNNENSPLLLSTQDRPSRKRQSPVPGTSKSAHRQKNGTQRNGAYGSV